MTLARKILRFVFIALLVTLAFAGGAIAVLTLTEKGRENLAGLVSSLASTPERSIRISGLSGVWANPTTIDQVIVEDRSGPWLALRAVQIDWSRLALLGLRFEADRIFSRRIEVARQPEPPTMASQPSDEAFSLPVSVSIKAIDLPDIALGAALAGGRVASVSAKGSAMAIASPFAVRSTLSVARSDGTQGDLEATIEFVPARNVLNLSMRASEPSGGIIANLLALPGAPSVDIVVSGEGSTSDWRGTGSFAVDGAVVTSLSGRHQLTDRGSVVEVKGDGEFARFLPRGVQALLEGKSGFDLAGTLTTAGGVQIERATIESSAVSARAQGSIDPKGASDFLLDIAAKRDSVALSFGTTERPFDLAVASASVRVFGDGPMPALDIAAHLPSITSPSGEFKDIDLRLHSDGFDLQTRTGPFNGSVGASSFVIDNPSIAPLVSGVLRAEVKGRLDGDLITVDAGSLVSDAVEASLGGTVSLSDGAVALAIKADVLAAALPAVTGPVLGERVALTTSLSRDGQGHVAAEALTLRSGGLSVDGAVRMLPEGIDANFTGSLADVSTFAQQAQGAIAFSATASGPLVAPDVVVTVTSASLLGAGQELTDLNLTATGKADIANFAADLSLTARLGGQALTAKTALVTIDGRRQLKDMAATFGQNRVSGDFVLDDRFLPDGILSLELANVGQIALLAGETVQGAVSGTARFTVGQAPGIALDAQVAALTRGDVSVTDFSIKAVVDDYVSAPSVSGKVLAKQLTSGSTLVTGIDVALTYAGGWTGFKGSATVAGNPAALAGRVSVSGGDVVVELDSAETVLQSYKADLARPARIVIADGLVTLDGLTLDVAGGQAVVTGTVGASLDIDARFAAPQDGAPLTFGGADNPINFTVRSAAVKARGALDALALDIDADVAKVSTRSAQLENLSIALQSPRFNPSTRVGEVSGKVMAGAFVIDDPTIAPLVSGTLDADLAGVLSQDALEVTAGTLRGDALNGAFTGRVSLRDGSIAFDLKAGILSSALPPAVRSVLGERTAVSATVGRDAGGRFVADKLSIISDGLDATGKIVLDDTSIDAVLSGTLDSVARLSPNAQGAVRFSATATGAPAAPDVTVTVNGDRIEAAGREIIGLKLEAIGKADMADPSAAVTLSGAVGNQPLTGSARLATRDGTRAVEDLSIALGDNRITGGLVLDENYLPQGTVDFAVPDIAPLAALALENVSGDVVGSVTFSVVEDQPQVSLTARAGSIRRGEVLAKNVMIDARIADYLTTPAITGRLRVADAASGSTMIKGVDVSLAQDGGWTGFDASATVSGIPAQAKGRVQMADGKTMIELSSGQAIVNGLRIPIGRSGIQIADGTATLDRFFVPLGDGSATISGKAGTTLDLAVTLVRVPASLASQFAPTLNAGGLISGTAKVSGAAGDPTVSYAVDWTGAGTSQTAAAGFGAMTIRSSGNFAAGRLTFDATLGEPSGLTLKGGGTVTTGGTPQLALRFDGAVPLSFLTARLAAQGLSLSGSSTVSLRISGPAMSPAIDGSVRASGLRFVDSRSGIAINDIATEIALAAGRATITRLTGTLSTGGNVSASGTVGVDATQGYPADLAVRITDGRYTDGQVVTTTMTGALAIKGPLVATPRLTGTITLGRTVITVPERLPSSLAQLDVKHRNAPANVRAQDQALNPAGTGGSNSGGLVLDLAVDASQQIFVQGRGLDAQLGGSVRLTGPVGAPQATGLFTMARGRLSILGKRLTFSRGTLGFSGSLVPYLDLAAESTATDATVTVLVTGPANNPKFGFSSIPLLPEDEVLARLVFGRSMSNLSPIQIAQLAEAAAQFAGVGGSTSLLDTLRGKIGVDDLDIKTNVDGSTAVSAGKYLNDRTYLTIEKGDKAGSGKASIDLNVGRGVKLRGEATDAGEAKGGIFFEREY